MARAATLKVGDIVFFGTSKRPVEITAIEQVETEEEVYDLQVEGAHSFLTQVCAVRTCDRGAGLCSAAALPDRGFQRGARRLGVWVERAGGLPAPTTRR